MTPEDAQRTQKPYRYGMILLCFGALINWIGLAENYTDPFRYAGVACIIGGAFLICTAMCCWLHVPNRSAVGVSEVIKNNNNNNKKRRCYTIRVLCITLCWSRYPYRGVIGWMRVSEHAPCTKIELKLCFEPNIHTYKYTTHTHTHTHRLHTLQFGKLIDTVHRKATSNVMSSSWNEHCVQSESLTMIQPVTRRWPRCTSSFAINWCLVGYGRAFTMRLCVI